MPHLIKGTRTAQRTVVIGVCCVLGLVLGGFGVCLGSKKNRQAAAPATPDAAHQVTMPPTDASAPTHTETATFALG